MLKDIDIREKVAIESIKKAGEILVGSLDESVHMKIKSDETLVTEVDLKVEATILKLIREKFPKDSILSEETGNTTSDGPFRWIIDPLDGTHNYIRRISTIGSSIALQLEDTVVLGVIYMPFTRELYIAKRGNGTYCNGKKIRVSERDMNRATLVFDSNIISDKTGLMLDHFRKVTGNVFNLRMFGSTARSLSYLAEGKVDVEIEYTDKIWDFASGAILIEEAGGKVTDLGGNKWNTEMKEYLASNGLIHEHILKILNS